MNWNTLTSIQDLDKIDAESQHEKIMILKHSIRCSISDAALGRLNRKWKDEDAQIVKPYYLDLITHRDVSNAIAERYHIRHESPQILVISNGQCIFSQTHMSINLDEILAAAK